MAAAVKLDGFLVLSGVPVLAIDALPGRCGGVPHGIFGRESLCEPVRLATQDTPVDLPVHAVARNENVPAELLLP